VIQSTLRSRLTVSHLTLDQAIVGSNPTSSAILSKEIENQDFQYRSHGLVVRTPASQAGNTGSNPVGTTKAYK
jgi:hypothetical protein